MRSCTCIEYHVMMYLSYQQPLPMRHDFPEQQWKIFRRVWGRLTWHAKDETLTVECLCMWVCLAWYRGRGALSEESPDNHRHLRDSVGGGHRVCGGLLQNQVSTSKHICDSSTISVIGFSTLHTVALRSAWCGECDSGSVSERVTLPHYSLPPRKQRKKMHNHLRQNMCLDHPNRSLANGPNHPGPGPEEIPMVDVGLLQTHYIIHEFEYF